MGNIFTCDLAYADYVIFLAPTKHDAENMPWVLQEILNYFSTGMNKSK